jgi:peptide/nickel transport system substrate-binding protein
MGVITAGPTLPLNPLLVFGPAQALLSWSIFNQLNALNNDVSGLAPQLATSWEPNSDASVWTVTLRSGVTFHNGKPLTADDLIWSIPLWLKGYGYGQTLYIDLKGVRKRGPLTVEIPLIQPIADFPPLASWYANQPIVPHGTTTKDLATHPIGTGPFKFVSASGNITNLEANPDYWDHPKPYVEKLIFNQQFSDDEARLNALLAGQIDIDFQSAFLQTKQQISNPNVTVLGAPNVFSNGLIIMRVDKGPLADVRVRQAMKLIADRPALCEGASAGFANVANDLFAPTAPHYAKDLPQRTQDIEQAKSLLKAAGKDGATFTLRTSPYADGVVQAATLFAQQASAAGINIKVQTVPPGTYFTPPGGLLTDSFRQDTYDPFSALSVPYLSYFTPKSTVNETHWGSQPGGAASVKRIEQAIAATNPSTAQELWHNVQKEQYDQGGFVVWGNSYSISLVAKKIKGLIETPAGFLNSGQSLAEMWVE